jgi:molecular chaperone GrpE
VTDEKITNDIKDTEAGEHVDNNASVSAAANGEDNQVADQGEHDYGALKDLLSKTEAEAAEYLDLVRRTQAEMDNYRKRMMKEQAQIVECAAQSVLMELLPVIDNLERAIVAAKTTNEAGSLLNGVELVLSQILGILEKQSVEIIDPAGEQFDPEKHEAVMQMESKAHSENTVIEVVQKGYDLKGRLLRPAMVVVAK